ncbi:MAG: glycosyltransferase family 4 protein [Patescibacteria group bacterium]
MNFKKKKYSQPVEKMRSLQKKVAKGAKLIITPSEYLKGIVKKWGVNENKIKVIYNSVEKIELELNNEEAKEKINLAGNIILSVGRLVSWKGFSLLIDLMPEFLKINKNFKLLIIGEGPEREKLEFRIKPCLPAGRNSELTNSVYLLDAVPQEKLWVYFRAADIFILNTGYEGLPHIIIEAMQIGTPVITTDVGGNKEVIENNRTGLIVEYNNKVEIKDTIIKLWKDKNLADNLTSAAKNEVATKFSREKMLKEIMKVFTQIYR